MRRKLCWRTEILAFPISLHQTGTDRFTVTYGQQVHSGRTYVEAAASLGECIMHAVACEGKLELPS